MQKHEQEAKLSKDLVKTMAPEPEYESIEDMPLNTLGDYMRHNKACIKLNKKLGVCRYKVKQCPLELHPTDRITFGRIDQPNNKLKVYLSNDIIHFDKTLVPGETYDLPRMIVDYLAEKGTPVWKWFNNPDGSKETRISHKDPRFALRQAARSYGD